MVPFQQVDLRQGLGTEIADPNRTEIDLELNAGMGNRLEYAIGVGIATLVNENTDAVFARARAQVGIRGVTRNEGAAAHAPHNGPIVDQSLERLANRQKVTLVGNGEIPFRRQLRPQRKGLRKLAYLGFNSLVF